MAETDDASIGRQTLAKVSWRILPLIAVGYAIAYTDRINISFAAAKMNQDLHFSAAIYGLGGGLFFLSYALFEVPSNMLLVRFGARRWIARIMVTWGLLAIGMMFVRTPIQFYVMRFLLGLAEAGFFPGVIVYLSGWFPIAHRARAISRFYVAWPISQIVMGAVAGALLGLHGHLGLRGWQWLFLIEGLPAVLMSAVILKFLPDSPATSAWLSGPQRDWIIRSLATDALRMGDPDHSFRRALTRPLVLVMGFVNALMLGSFYAFTLSAPILLGAATHLDPTHVGYLISLAGVAGVVGMIGNGWLSDRNQERYFHLAVPLVLTGLAFGLVGHATAPLVVMAAYLAAIGFNSSAGAVFWMVPGEIISPASAAVSVAAINTLGQLGSFVAPSAWGLAKDLTGDFKGGMTAVSCAFLLAALVVLGVRAVMRRRLALTPAVA